MLSRKFFRFFVVPKPHFLPVLILAALGISPASAHQHGHGPPGQAGPALAREYHGTPDTNGAFTNPYHGVDWESAGHYDANLHTHTNLSDGHHDPHYVIDKYHGLGYKILALTDHDSLHFEFRPQALYPWTKLNEIFHEIKDETNTRFDKTYQDLVQEEWQNRDPEELGMVSVPGSEISRTHHLGSLFNDYAGGTTSEETAFSEIGKRGGLSLFFHPGRYDRNTDWYIDYYNRHPHVVGMEIYNQVDRFPVDRARWDRILHRMMPERPVWGFANDDTHTDEHFGRNRNIFLLSELKSKNVFDAMQLGQFYLFVPTEQGVRPAVRLTGAVVTGDIIRLRLTGNYDRIEWITHNPATDDSQAIGSGPTIAKADLPAGSTFVRAVIICERGRTYTQPFGLKKD